MIAPPWLKRLRQSVIPVLIAIPGSVLALIGWIHWEIRATYADYRQVEACLERHQLDVVDSWQHRDMTLEDFSWTFRTADGQQLSIDIYDGDKARDCNHRVAGVHLRPETFGAGKYLLFSHPELVDALDGQQLQTMDDMLENLDQLLAWVEENPDFKVDPAAVDRNQGRYLNLIIGPS